MSAATKKAITALMEADTDLIALLAKDPNDKSVSPRPAIFNVRKSDAPPVYDCVTWRELNSNADQRFVSPLPAAPGSGSASPIIDEYYDFEVWSQKQSSKPLSDIADRLTALFNNTAFAIDGGRVFKSVEITRNMDLYDPTLKARFALIRYRLRVKVS